MATLTQSAASLIPTLIYALGKAKGDTVLASGTDRVKSNPQIKSIIDKAVIEGGAVGNPAYAPLAEYNRAVTAYIELMRHRSAFYRLLTDMRRVPLETRLITTTANTTAYIVGEGKAVPLSKMAFKGWMMTPIKAAAMIVVSEELFKMAETEAQTIINRDLQNSVGNVIDTEFSKIVLDGLTPITATSDYLADMRKMLAVVNTSATTRPYWIVGTNLSNILATKTNTAGNLAFPAFGVNGGEILHLPAIVSSGVNPNTLMLVDANEIAANAGTIEIKVSTQGAIEMSDEPNNDTTPNATDLVSLWQNNLIAVKVMAYFGVERLSDKAAAVINGAATAWE